MTVQNRSIKPNPSQVVSLGQAEVRCCEDFLRLMEPISIHKATLASFADQHPTVGLMYPQQIYSPCNEDDAFQQKIKRAILRTWRKRTLYLNDVLEEFLEEATVLNPRVKDKSPPDRINNKLLALPT